LAFLFPATLESFSHTCLGFLLLPILVVGRDSSVGIAPRYRLDGPRIESRWRARFSAPVQIGPEAQPTSCIVGTGSLSRGLSGRRMALTAHPQLAPKLRKEYSYTSVPPLDLFMIRSRAIQPN
jgi:hypothetical protein